ncbi:Hypothetical protein AJAP_42755 (plasmid) [Amycolatopsis japonica]|uniref:Uncharacterized protein n=1 Tax=Amycolatopsis japonica TaxID=208439 RepID=A0A075V770_9PSEU|nr:hypothetical protein [Amycolatopsis japonica]AIG81318.1 Hypothetical protein AJAP_42755 [Amycolatopsis japonica]
MNPDQIRDAIDTGLRSYGYREGRTLKGPQAWRHAWPSALVDHLTAQLVDTLSAEQPEPAANAG